MPQLNSENRELLIASVLITLASFAMLGFAGLRTVFMIIAVMFMPVYLIFNKLNLSHGEKIIFSFFASITIFPSLVYWLGFLIPFKFSILAVFLMLLASSFIQNKFVKKATSSN